ncbi:phosphate ABC transporter permease PstA [Sphaerochaeta sp.]|uniref:phosphate ABC transporter permease PstA n=1 Tax=Sphaerochaeta sp. TaxID=1972642 RepID=UPI002FC6F5B2
MVDRRKQHNAIALLVIKVLSFSTILLMALLLGYLVFRGLVRTDVTVSAYLPTENAPFRVYSGASQPASLDRKQLQDLLEGNLYRMRTLSGYDDPVTVYVQSSIVDALSSSLAVDAATIKENTTLYTPGEKLSSKAGIYVFTDPAAAKPSGFKPIGVRNTVVQVNPSVTALYNNKKLSILSEEQLSALLGGSVTNWSQIGGPDLQAHAVASSQAVTSQDGAYRVYDNVDASDAATLQVRLQHTVANLSWKYIFAPSVQGGRYGGVGTIIINTLLMILLSALLATPIGIGTAIYLVEYAKQGRMRMIIQSAVDLLASVPSIIYGLFGMLIFVQFLGWSFSLASGSLTVGLMIIPTIVRTSQEALKQVDRSIIDGSIALGATKIETIGKICLPSARDGIVSGLILAIGRAAGETAALLYTIGSGTDVAHTLLSPARSLSMHIYLLVVEGKGLEGAFAASLILMIVVLFTNMVAKVLSRKEKR